MHYPRHCLAHYQYFLQYHQRYSLQCPTHASTPTTLPMPPTLACQPRNPSQHATHASTLPTQAHHPHHPLKHASTLPAPPTLARQLRKHVTHASTPPTLARIARHFSNSFHTISFLCQVQTTQGPYGKKSKHFQKQVTDIYQNIS